MDTAIIYILPTLIKNSHHSLSLKYLILSKPGFLNDEMKTCWQIAKICLSFKEKSCPRKCRCVYER